MQVLLTGPGVRWQHVQALAECLASYPHVHTLRCLSTCMSDQVCKQLPHMQVCRRAPHSCLPRRDTLMR
jgi:hypothetical protein